MFEEKGQDEQESTDEEDETHEQDEVEVIVLDEVETRPTPHQPNRSHKRKQDEGNSEGRS